MGDLKNADQSFAEYREKFAQVLTRPVEPLSGDVFYMTALLIGTFVEPKLNPARWTTRTSSCNGCWTMQH